MTTPMPIHSHDPHEGARLARLHQGVTSLAHSANEANLSSRNAEQQAALIRGRYPQYYGNTGVAVRHILFLSAVAAAATFQCNAEGAPFVDFTSSMGWPVWWGRFLPVIVFIIDLGLAERCAREQDEAIPGQSSGSIQLLRWVMLLAVTSAVASGRIAELEKGDPNWVANTPAAEWVAAAFWVTITIIAHSFVLFSGHHFVEAMGFVGVRVKTWRLDAETRTRSQKFREHCRSANTVLLRYEEGRQRYEVLHGVGSMPARGFDQITVATLNSYNTGMPPPTEPLQTPSPPPTSAEARSSPDADPGFGAGGSPAAPSQPSNEAADQRPEDTRDGEDEVRA